MASGGKISKHVYLFPPYAYFTLYITYFTYNMYAK